LPKKCGVQGGSEWVAAQRDTLSGLGAAEIPASSRQKEGASPLARAQALLALTANPRTMPCRDNERAAITSFVEDSLTAGRSSLLLPKLCPTVFCTVYSTAYVARILAVRVHEAVLCTRASRQLLSDCSAMAFQLVMGQRSGSESDHSPDWSITYI
jgi:hypothetical protein